MLFACKQEGEKDAGNLPVQEDVVTPDKTSVGKTDTNYDPATVNDALAAEVAVKLQELFSKELEIMTSDDRSFRMYALNMDQDTHEEVFVLFSSPYFCGSAGCNLLLLDDDLRVITRFTVTRPPISIEPTYTNDWRDISIYSEDSWRAMTFNGQSYPSNPSVAPILASGSPSQIGVLIFSNEASALPAKGYGF
ncbi:hypothetical protein E7Z59_14865 [Robertkochia marina]|uniref:Uncharacterized protein n=1 Tax=Robertkochia marina TaxID=1227945 RepID=A0A4S3LZY7_9FLAO|nr:hypothetical protein [Robertkochia marina]THD65859.1 hypothetical protein E7Z59_14865 [Robertkochia marina]TRZ41362.1 hypothetical protein D3A96_13475 [Robertkochia marina]